MVLKQRKQRIKSRPRISLRVFLIVPFTLQIFVAVSLVGYFSFKNGQQIANDTSAQLREDASNRIYRHLDDYLSSADAINSMNRDLFQRGILDINDFSGVGRYFWQQVSVHKNITYIGYALQDGRFIGAGRVNPTKDGVTIDELSPQTANQFVAYSTNASGDRQEIVYRDETYKPATEDWYTKGIQFYRESRTVSIEGEYISVNVNLPLLDRDRKTVGVMGVDFQLTDVGKFLQSLKTSANTEVFIIERQTGHLIAQTDEQKPFIQHEGKSARLPINQSANPLMRATATSLVKQFGSFKAIQKTQKMDFYLSGKQPLSRGLQILTQRQSDRQFVQVTPWKDTYGLDWLIIVVMPESDFMGEVYSNSRINLLLCFVTLLLVTLLGILTARWITRPILQLNQASQILSATTQKGAIAGSPDLEMNDFLIDEIDTLKTSFQEMSAQLKNSFLQLEETNEALEQANETLEARVEERTQALSATLADLQQTQSQLVHTEKMSSLGQMVAGIAHELNNPIGFIQGNLKHTQTYFNDLLKLITLYQAHAQTNAQTNLDSDRAIQSSPDLPIHSPEIAAFIQSIDLEFMTQDIPKVIASMRDGTDRVNQIVLSLRNFSRLDETGVKLSNIHEGLEGSLLLLNHRLNTGIELVRDYGDLPLVQCNAAQINQVFIHLLTNAIDALSGEIKQAEKWIHIRTRQISTNQIQIEIQDNGAGIPEAIQSRIFDPFFTTKPVGQGTGLGLAVCYQMIQNHHGQIQVQSQINQGTCFTILLPVEP